MTRVLTLVVSPSAAVARLLSVALCVALGAASGLTGCSDFDGGLVPVDKLPRPQPAETTSDTSPDAEVAPAEAITFVRPAAGASVDGDWIEVEVTTTGFTLGAGQAIVVSVVVAGDAGPSIVATVPLTGLTGVVQAPAGAVTLVATLTAGGAPVEPAVSAQIDVTATRVAPAVAFVTPVAGQRFDIGTTVAYEVATTDFTVLALGAAPVGPRQGRVQIALDDAAPTIIGAKSGTLGEVATGQHTLTATLVAADGTPWPGAAPATVTFAVDLPPTLTIVAPADGSDVEGSRLTITVATERFELDGASTPGHGTWRATLDGVDVASDLTGPSATITGLSAGAHTLVAELRTGADAALVPPVTATSTFETVLRPPALDFVLPTSTRVAEGTVRVAVLPHFFAFTGGAIPGPLVPATGGWQLLVDDVLVQDALTSAQTEVVLQPGARRITARLVDNGGTQLVPPVTITRTLDVVAVETAVEILSPVAGQTVPRRFPVAVAFEDFKLTQNVLEPNDDPVPGQGHFHAFLRKEGSEDFVYQGFFLTETFEIEADSAGEWDVLVALHYENHSPVLPPVEATVRVTVDDRPTIHVRSPRDGDVVGVDPMAVAVAIDNFELIPVGEVSNTRGHYHLFIDGVYQDFYVQPVALIDPRATLPAALAPGPHRLEAFLHKSDHTPVAGAVGQIVDLVYDPTPQVRIVAVSSVAPPTDGVRVTTAPFEVRFELDNLALVDKAGDAPVPGEGHVHVFVDDVYQGFETRAAFPLTIAEAGPHTVKLTLHENDHSAIAGTAPAFVEVVVDATPRVAFLAPQDMGFAYGGDLDVRFAPENLPDDARVELWLDDVLVYEGAPDTVTLPRPTEGMHELFTVPLASDGTPLPDGAVTTIVFEAIALGPPTVTFVSPLQNATLLPGAQVTIGVTGFALEGTLGRSPAVPGDGLWTLSVGAQTWGPFATPTVSVPALPRGPARLVAELWHRDGSRVVSSRPAEVAVQIGGTGPRMSLAEPPNGASVYGPDVVVRADVADAPLGVGQGWLSVKVDGRQAALLARPHGVIGPFEPGLHVLELELLDAARQPYAPAVKGTSQFRVGGAEVPTLRLTAPANDADVGASVDVAFAVTDFTLDAIGLRGRAQSGRGAVLVSVDGRVRTIATSSPAKLEGLSDGAHTITLTLVGLDLVPIAPAVSAHVDVR